MIKKKKHPPKTKAKLFKYKEEEESFGSPAARGGPASLQSARRGGAQAGHTGSRGKCAPSRAGLKDTSGPRLAGAGRVPLEEQVQPFRHPAPFNLISLPQALSRLYWN